MDYSFDVLISWIGNLNLYNWFCHICFSCCLIVWSCMSVLMTRFSIHAFDLNLSIHMCLSMHATWRSHHHSSESSDSPGSSCPGLGSWSVWILPVADQSDAALAWVSSRRPEPHPFRPSCTALEFFCYDSEPSFVLFILVHPLYSSICAILVM